MRRVGGMRVETSQGLAQSYRKCKSAKFTIRCGNTEILLLLSSLCQKGVKVSRHTSQLGHVGSWNSGLTDIAEMPSFLLSLANLSSR